MARRGGKRRDPAREQFWRRMIQQQENSGLTVPDFCLREGLKDWTFRWWRQELARRDRQPATGPREVGGGEPTKTAPVFLPVRVVDLEPGSPHTPPSIEILLATGPIIRVPS